MNNFTVKLHTIILTTKPAEHAEADDGLQEQQLRFLSIQNNCHP
jgi:hypothetical protein